MPSRPPESRSVPMSGREATNLETTLRGAMESYNFQLWIVTALFRFLGDSGCCPMDDPPIGPVPTILLEGSGESRRSVGFIHCPGVRKKEGILLDETTLKRARIQGPSRYVSPFHITRLTELTIFFRPFPAEEETLRSPQETRGFSEVGAFPLAQHSRLPRPFLARFGWLGGVDAWVVEALREGYMILFSRRPPLSDQPLPMPSYSPSSIKGRALEKEFIDLLHKGAIERAPQTPGFYSRLFVVQKDSGSGRPIIDLSTLNTFIVSQQVFYEAYGSNIRHSPSLRYQDPPIPR